jgi:hypothetical protein
MVETDTVIMILRSMLRRMIAVYFCLLRVPTLLPQWPGIWTMGNLARPGYPATTDGMWPYTYVPPHLHRTTVALTSCSVTARAMLVHSRTRQIKTGSGRLQLFIRMRRGQDTITS